MTCIADANILFPLLVSSHAARSSALSWWEKQGDGTVGLCLLARFAILRLLTNRGAMNGTPASPATALEAWAILEMDPRCVLVSSVPVRHESLFKALVMGREPTPNLWTHAWLAALAQALDCEMVTFDRGFRSFQNLKLRLLEA